VIIVSDAKDYVAGKQVIDILERLPASYSDDNPDWAAYSNQQQKLQAGGTIDDKSPEGWRLDRFKFLPMVEEAFRKSPNAKWYVFIETDIYYFWDSLFRVLDRLDSNKHHYLGSPAPGPPNFWFAYGGAGIVLSGRLVRDLLVHGDEQLSVKYESLAKSDPSGDAILGYAIDQEVGIRLGHLYPTLPGEDIEGLRITPDKWCTPLVGLHRVSEEQMAALWAWERCRSFTEQPITYSAFLDFGIGPLLQNGSQISFWDNGADAGRRVDQVLIADCADACERGSHCLQYSHVEGTCYLADYIQLGRAVDNEVISGWAMTHPEERGSFLFEDSVATCEHVKWLKPKIGKPFP
jgi:hypothetical protein